MPLSEKYFRLIAANGESPHYDQYECVMPAQTVVCFSAKTMTPIMAVTLRAGEKEKPAAALVTHRAPPPKKSSVVKDARQQYFQGLLSCDNCEFQFVVSNLTDSNLSFSVYEAEAKDVCNLVNTLRGRSTYEIPCDKRTQRAMILTALKDAATGTLVTMAEAEEKAAPGKSGSLEFHINCVGEVNTTSGKLIAEGPTQWMMVPGVVLSRDKRKILERGYRFGSEPMLLEDGMMLLEGTDGAAQPQYRSLTESLGGSIGRRGGYPTTKKKGGRRAVEKGGGSNIHKLGSSHVAEPPPLSRSLTKGKPTTSNPEEEYDGGDSSMDLFGAAAPPPASQATSSVLATINRSFAGRLTHGEKEIRESANTIYGLEFDYEKPSSRMAMILSVWLDGFPQALPRTDPESLADYFATLTKLRDGAHYEALLKQIPQVFTADECVVTMEPVDTVIATCGHACLNHTAADATKLNHKCPVCRNPILAFVPLANLRV